MAYSEKDWELVKHYYEIGLSLSDIIGREEVKIKSKSQISKRAHKENWERNEKKKQLIEREVAVKSALATISDEKETLKETELKIHNEIVDETIKRNNAIDTVAKKALLKIGKLIDNAETLKDMKDGADAIGKVKDILLPETKKPDNAVNVTVNTTQVTQAKTAEEASKVYMDLIGR